MKKLTQLFFAVALLVGMSTSAFAACPANTFQWPSGSVAINTSGTITTISTCSFGGDYSVLSGVTAGQSLKLTMDVAGSMAEVRTGSPSGPVVATGTLPLTFSSPVSGNLYVHWYLAGCGVDFSCHTTTVQCVSCAPAPAPANDLCANATTIACGDVVNGSTTTATFDAAPTCGTSVDNNGSVWYKFIGTGGSATIQTCGGTTNFDTKLHVYTGTCANLVCVVGNDDFCGLSSSVDLCTQAGTTYLVRVSGFGSASGNFTLSVACAPPATNDLCANAINIGCNSSASGSTRCATVDGGLPFCGTSGGSAPGLWYKFTGNGGFANLSTCNAGTNYDTKLHVFTGSCGNFTCVTGNDDDAACTTGPGTAGFKSTVSFCSQAGTDYYVLVHGFSTTSVGEFQLDLNCSAPLTVEAGDCQTRFVGYSGPGAPDPLNYICPTITGGTAPYTTTVSAATVHQCDNGCYAVAPTATTTYTITVTDDNGCSASDQVTVSVVDVVAACPSNGQPKVQICHVPPGNPGNAHNLCVSPNAVPAHLAGGSGHGTCYLGPCGNTCRNTNAACEPSACSGGTYTITISGAGFLDETTWSFAGSTGGPYGLGTTNTATVTVPSGTPSTFILETQGSFNDNVADYTISCGGNIITSGTLGGGQTTTINGICCGGLIAPKFAAPSLGNGLVVFPNPFSEATTFKFRSATNGHASIVVYNLAGQQVANVFDGEVASGGSYEVNFTASNLSAGAYMYRYTNAEGTMSMGKVNLVK